MDVQFSAHSMYNVCRSCNKHYEKKTNPVVKVVDFVSEVSDVVSQILAVFFAFRRLHRLASGARTKLL